MNRKKVLFLLDCLYGDAGGGSERQFLKLYRYTKQIGVDPCVVFLKDQPVHSKISWERDPVTLELSSLFSFNLFKSVKKLLHIVDSQNIKVLHALFDDACILAGIVKRLRPSLTLVLSQRNIGYNHKGFKRFFLKDVFSRADFVAVNAPAIERYVVSSLGVVASKVLVTPNMYEKTGGTLDQDSKDFFDGLKDRFSKVAITVSNLRPVKGIDDLVTAISLLKNKSVAFVIIGAGDVEVYQDRAKALGVHERVFFMGRRDNASLYMQQAHIGILPSHSEGLSNTLIEYMFSKLEIIATDVGGNSDALNGGSLGCLTPAKAPELLALAIDRLVEKMDHAEAKGELAYASAIENYSPDQVVRKYQILYGIE